MSVGGGSPSGEELRNEDIVMSTNKNKVSDVFFARH